LQGDQRVTHFKAGRDTVRHLWLHTRLLALAMLPRPHRAICPTNADSNTSVRFSSWRGFLKWVSPKELFRMVRSHPEEQTMLAIAIAVGVFIANLPIYGMQTLLSLYLSRRWHLHPLAVVFGSYFSTPPIGPVLIAADVELGHILLTGKLLQAKDFAITGTPIMALLNRTLIEWVLGSLLLGVILAIAAFLTILLLFHLMPLKESHEAGSK
jgi:uncharacterized protein (DUF2062 family)